MYVFNNCSSFVILIDKTQNMYQSRPRTLNRYCTTQANGEFLNFSMNLKAKDITIVFMRLLYTLVIGCVD